MSASEKTIRLTIDLTYNYEFMHGDDPESIEWFQGMLRGDNLQLVESFDVGDIIGTVKVVDCNPTQDERVKALVAAAIAEDTATNRCATSRERKQYLRGRIEALKDLRAALRDMKGGE